MIIETLTIFYYSIASLSIGLVLCQTYNIHITKCINKWVYNYEPLNTYDNNENDLGVYKQLNDTDDSYILFNNETNNNETNNNETNNNEINNNETNNNEINNNKINKNKINNNLNIKTKKNVIIDFE